MMKAKPAIPAARDPACCSKLPSRCPSGPAARGPGSPHWYLVERDGPSSGRSPRRTRPRGADVTITATTEALATFIFDRPDLDLDITGETAPNQKQPPPPGSARTPPDPDKRSPRPRSRRPGGCFRRWWRVLGLTKRRLSRRFYSTLLLSESPPADQRICAPRLDCGPPPSAMRPCAPDFGAVKATDGSGKGHGRRRTARAGAVC
jgi:hypothetical protein